MSDCEFVQIAHLVVSREKQHRGVGHALINAASDFAAERHIEHVTTGVYPSLREANRFYARLGFAPLSVRRIAPVSALRRRAAADRSAPLVADSLRRRARIVRQLPPQRARPAAVERVDS